MQDVGQGQVICEGRPIPKEVPKFSPEIPNKNGLKIWVTLGSTT